MSPWVDRSVRLPKERGEYLVYKAGIGKVAIANYGTSKHFENGRDDLLGVGNPYRITHWMPLPEPPNMPSINEPVPAADAFTAAREMHPRDGNESCNGTLLGYRVPGAWAADVSSKAEASGRAAIREVCKGAARSAMHYHVPIAETSRSNRGRKSRC
jgi:hypothetical protein